MPLSLSQGRGREPCPGVRCVRSAGWPGSIPSESSSSNGACLPPTENWQVVNQSAKLLNKTVLSLYLNKYSFKTPWKVSLEFRIPRVLGVPWWNMAAQRHSARSLSSHSEGGGAHPLPYGRTSKLQRPLTLQAAALWPPFGLGICTWSSVLPLSVRSWKRPRDIWVGDSKILNMEHGLEGTASGFQPHRLLEVGLQTWPEEGQRQPSSP